MHNLIKKVLGNRAESDQVTSSAQVAEQIGDDWRVELEERQAERERREAENMTARKAEYHRLMALLASGDAIELQHGQIQFGDGPQMSFLTELNSFVRLRELMRSGATKVVDVLNYAPRFGGCNRPSITSVRSDRIGYISAYQDGRWFLVDGRVHHVSQEDIDEFGDETE